MFYGRNTSDLAGNPGAGMRKQFWNAKKNSSRNRLQQGEPSDGGFGKRIGYHLGNYDAYVNIAGGIKINEPAIDLGIVMAIVSSYKNRPFDERTIVFGEVGLSGEVRAVNMPEQRVAEAKKLGFETCIVPEVSLDSVKSIGGIKIIGVKSINEAIGLIE